MVSPRETWTRSRPMNIVIVALVISGLLFVLTTLNFYRIYQDHTELTEKDAALQAQVRHLEYLHTSLPLVANLAVITGEPGWQARHKELTAEYDQAAQQVAVQVQGTTMASASVERQALTDHEALAIDRARRGAGDRVALMSLSEARLEQTSLTERIQALEHEVAEHRSTELRDFQLNLMRAVFLSAASVVLLLPGWLLVLSLVRQFMHRRQEDEDDLRLAYAEVGEKNRELSDLAAELEEVERVKNAFLSNTIHGLRTSLNAVMGFGEMLLEDAREDYPELVGDLQKLNQAARHLQSLVNDALDPTRIEAGRRGIYLESFEVWDLIQDVMRTIHAFAENYSIQLDVVCADEIGVMRTDATKVRNALLNILVAVCKYLEHGSVTLNVTHEALDGVQHISFCIADSGMEESQRRRMLEALSQARGAASASGKGTGSGLVLTYQYMALLGGNVDVRSVAGEGSTFTLTLPAQFTAK